MPAFFIVRRFDAQKCGKDYYDVAVLFVIRRFYAQKCGKDYYDVTVTKVCGIRLALKTVAKTRIACFATRTT